MAVTGITLLYADMVQSNFGVGRPYDTLRTRSRVRIQPHEDIAYIPNLKICITLMLHINKRIAR